MSTKRKRNRKSWLLAGAICLLLSVAGLAARSISQVEAGVRESAPTEHFKSGAQRSEAILAQILTTLQRMDERMARIEQSIKKAASDARLAAPREVGR